MSQTQVIDWEVFRSNLELLVEVEGSAEELAVRTGIPYFTIHNWRKRDQTPRIGSIKVLADEYHLTVDDLIGRHLLRDEIKPAAPRM